MKVGIYETVEVSDDQRVAIAARLDGAGAKKRQATRDEMKKFIWDCGSEWESILDGSDPVEPVDDEDEDLI